VGARHQVADRRGAVLAGDALQAGLVESGAEGTAFTMQHHGTHPRIATQLRDGVGQRPEHLRVERVHLVRAHHRDLGHARARPP
jgi:hypothetical protein